MGRILINELSSILTKRKDLGKKKASTFINELFNVIQEGLEEDRIVKVKGLGTFKIIEVDDRESVNVNTGERVLIEGHSKISFTPDNLMKELVNKPFSQFETVVLNEGVDFADTPDEEPAPAEPEADKNIEPAIAPLVEFDTDETEESTAPVGTVAPEVSAPVETNSQEVSSVQTPEPETQIPEPVEAKLSVQVSEPEPTVQEPEEPEPEKVANSEETTAEGMPEPTEPEVEFEETESDFNWKKWLLPIIFILIVFAGGYWIGTSSNSQEEVKSEKPVANTEVQKSKETPAPVVSTPMKEAQESDGDSDNEDDIKKEVEQKATDQKTSDQKAETIQTSDSDDLDQYEKMDTQVRVGAYRIIGTDSVLKIRQDDNLTRICKRTLGPGMECYIKVYNNIKSDSELKPGQEIKIPKLELKKKKKNSNNGIRMKKFLKT